MIVVSLLLILVSGGLLATGILQANDPFVMASIGVSVLAAAALFLGIRQQRGSVDVDHAVSPSAAAPQNRGAAAAGRVLPADAGRAAPAGIANSTAAAERRRTPVGAAPAAAGRAQTGAPPQTARPPINPAPPVNPLRRSAATPAVGSAAVGAAAAVGSAAVTDQPTKPSLLDQATTRIDRDAVEAGSPARGTSGPARTTPVPGKPPTTAPPRPTAPAKPPTHVPPKPAPLRPVPPRPARLSRSSRKTATPRSSRPAARPRTMTPRSSRPSRARPPRSSTGTPSRRRSAASAEAEPDDVQDAPADRMPRPR